MTSSKMNKGRNASKRLGTTDFETKHTNHLTKSLQFFQRCEASLKGQRLSYLAKSFHQED